MSVWKRHFSEITGQVITAEDPEYNQYSKAFNGNFHKKPACIVFPNHTQDVSSALKVSRSIGKKVSVFNGGHSTVASGLNNGNVVLNMQEMNSISITTDKSQIKVGAGCLAHEVDQATAPFAKAIPLGDCPVVGICGLTLGGGVGFISRSKGLTIDYLIEAQIVTPDGTVKICSNEKNSELFKLLKGAGQGNFGVVTQLTFNLIDVPTNVYGGNICWDFKQANSILQKYDELIRSAPNELNLYCRINEEKGPMVKVYGMYCGDIKEGEAYFEELRSWGEPIFDNAKIYSYLEMQKINESTIVDSPCFLWKNGLLDGKMSNEFIETVVRMYAERPTPYCRINVDTINGAVHHQSESSAFPHRNSDYIVSVMGVWFTEENKGGALRWANQTMEKLRPFLNEGVYVNYADPSMADKPECYFGQMATSVKNMKNAVDSQNSLIGSLNPERTGFTL